MKFNIKNKRTNIPLTLKTIKFSNTISFSINQYMAVPSFELLDWQQVDILPSLDLLLLGDTCLHFWLFI